MDRGSCVWCRVEPVGGRKRKYCSEHSRQASAIWKREHRRLWKALGDKYWLADWKNKSPEERRAYFRAYMKRYRRRKKREREEASIRMQPAPLLPILAAALKGSRG